MTTPTELAAECRSAFDGDDITLMRRTLRKAHDALRRSAPVLSVEEIAKALCRFWVEQNLRFDPGKADDEKFIQRCVDAGWGFGEYREQARAVLTLLTPAETALSAIPVADSGAATPDDNDIGEVNKMVSGGDGIVERLLKINPWRDTDWPERIRDAAAEIKRLRAQVATARREAFEEATEWHKAEISRLERQIEDNNEYGRRTGQDFTRSAANEHCRSRINTHQWSIDDLLRRRDRSLKENRDGR